RNAEAWRKPASLNPLAGIRCRAYRWGRRTARRARPIVRLAARQSARPFAAIAPFRITLALARPDAILTPHAEEPMAVPLRACDGEGDRGQARIGRAVPSEPVTDDRHALNPALPLSDQQRPGFQDQRIAGRSSGRNLGFQAVVGAGRR